MRIGIDLDNTIINSPKRIFELMQEDGHISKDKIFHDNFGWDFDGLIDIELVPTSLKYFNDERFYDNIEFYPNAKEIIEKWLDANHTITIISHQPDKRADMTRRWISKTFSKPIIFIKTNGFDKSIMSKQIDMMIDDKPECLTSLLRSPGIKFYVLFGNYKWNNLHSDEFIELKNTYNTIPMELRFRKIIAPVLSWSELNWAFREIL